LLALIACVNVASLLVARAAARRRTTALCMTLGAGAGRLVHEHLIEGALLSAGGAIAGLLIAEVSLRLMVSWRPAGLDRIAHAHLDARVLLFACLLAIACGVLFSIAPVVDVVRASPAAVLQRDGQRVTGRLHQRTRAALVVTQLALGVVLIVGASLLGRTFVELQRVDPGFSSDHLLTFRLAVPVSRYRSREALDDFSRRLQSSLVGLPGVTGAGAISHLPFDDLPNWGGPYLVTSGGDATKAPEADYRSVSPGWLEAVGARIVEGRAFTESDDKSAPPAVIVDDLLAHRAWPGESAIGRQIEVDPGSSGHPTQWATVIGVVRHLRLRSLSEDLTEQVFFPVRQALRNPMAYVVRTSGDPAALAAPIRAVIHQMDAQLPVYDVQPLDRYVDGASASRRFTALLAAAFAGVALLLGAVGVYGLIAYGVARRRTEFGVRLALGAHRSQVVALVLREGLALGAIGLGLGAAGALGAARWLQSQLYGVTPFDPATYAIAMGVLGVAVLASSWLPARRAAGADPIGALRDE
jgi:predicted permease